MQASQGEHLESPVPIYLFHVIARLLKEEQLDPLRMLAGTRVTEADLNNPETFISIADALILVENALRLSRRPDLGLLVARGEDPSSWGMLGYAISSCATLEAAIKMMMRYYQTTTYFAAASYRRDEISGSVRLEAICPTGNALPFIMEESFGSALLLMRRATGLPLEPSVLRLTYDPPPYWRSYRDLFQCEVVFRQSCNEMILPASTLDQVLPTHNPAAHATAEKICAQLLAEQPRPGDLVYRIRHLLLHNPGRFFSAGDMAKELHVSERSLRRHLQHQGVTYQQLSNEVKARLADEYLRNSRLPLSEIAELLGFADASNFSRAYRRWTGKSPSQVRG